MSHLVVLIFEDMEQAGQVQEALKQVQRSGDLKLDDAAVIVKHESGKLEVKNQLDTGVKWGAVSGGLVGVLVASVFFPLAGLAIGTLGGALIGKALDLGIDQKFVREVSDTLKPGSSALFVLSSHGNPDEVIAALTPFQGAIYQTTLPTKAVYAMLEALKKSA